MARLYDAPLGQVQEFLKRLAAAGLTQEEMTRLTNNPGAMKEWVESLGNLSPAQIDRNTPIATLFNDRRTYKSLQRAYITTLDHLLDWTEDELRDIRLVGDRTIDIVKTVLDEYGLKLSGRTDEETRRDPARIYSLAGSYPTMRSWRRDKIGRLPLDAFVCFTEGPKDSMWPHKVVRDKIEDIAALRDNEIRGRYGEIPGQKIVDWLDENYRPWIG